MCCTTERTGMEVAQSVMARFRREGRKKGLAKHVSEFAGDSRLPIDIAYILISIQNLPTSVHPYRWHNLSHLIEHDYLGGFVWSATEEPNSVIRPVRFQARIYHLYCTHRRHSEPCLTYRSLCVKSSNQDRWFGMNGVTDNGLLTGPERARKGLSLYPGMSSNTRRLNYPNIIMD